VVTFIAILGLIRSAVKQWAPHSGVGKSYIVLPWHVQSRQITRYVHSAGLKQASCVQALYYPCQVLGNGQLPIAVIFVTLACEAGTRSLTCRQRTALQGNCRVLLADELKVESLASNPP
jgi:hypothetical protein